MTSSVSDPKSVFEKTFVELRNDLVNDDRKPESKRNKTGNLWKYSLKAALEAAGFTVILEKPHEVYDNGQFFDYLKM